MQTVAPNGSAVLQARRAPCERYINEGCRSRRDLVLSAVSPALPFRLNARSLVREVQAARAEQRQPLAERSLRIEPYRGDNAAVLRMKVYLQTHLADDLAGAYILGSLGTGEEIAYSDFDALAIIRNEVFDDAQRLSRVGHMLSRARRIMFEHDPLQHHGWFVITEAELEHYPEDYLPLEVLAYGKALVPNEAHSLRIRELPPLSGTVSFLRLAAAVQRRTEPRGRPRNLYQLKGFLSQVMLLPARYVQARDGRGVFKKWSFDFAKSDFTADDWRVMETVSRLRMEWLQPVSGLRRRLLVSCRPGIRKVVIRFAPEIPSAWARSLSPAFYADVARLVTLMKGRVAGASDMGEARPIAGVG